VSLSAALKGLDRWQAGHRALGVPVAVAKKFVDDDAAGLGVQIAYWGFFSVFSLLLAFTSLLGFAFNGDPGFQQRVLDSTLRLMPVIGPQISGQTGSLTGSGVAVVVGLVGAIWTGLGVTLAFGRALDDIWSVPGVDRHGPLSSRSRGLVVLVVVGAVSVATTAMVAIAATGGAESTVARIVSIAGGGCVDVVLFLTSFRLLTAAAVTIRQVLPGATLAAGCWLLLQALGGVYVSNVLKGSSQTYGSFAAVVGLLTWLLIAAELTLVAAEVNVVLARGLWPRSLAGSLRPADEEALRNSAEAEQRDRRQHITVTFEESAAGDREQ
jgi:YihY family inner membrane protein